MRKVMKNTVFIRGTLLCLKEGRRALILHDGMRTRTDIVVSIKDVTLSYARFETQNERYHVSFAPQKARMPGCKALPACA